MAWNRLFVWQVSSVFQKSEALELSKNGYNYTVWILPTQYSLAFLFFTISHTCIFFHIPSSSMYDQIFFVLSRYMEVFILINRYSIHAYISIHTFLLICTNTCFHTCTNQNKKERNWGLPSGIFRECINLLRIDLRPCSNSKSEMFPLIWRNQEVTKLNVKKHYNESDKTKINMMYLILKC